MHVLGGGVLHRALHFDVADGPALGLRGAELQDVPLPRGDAVLELMLLFCEDARARVRAGGVGVCTGVRVCARVPGRVDGF